MTQSPINTDMLDFLPGAAPPFDPEFAPWAHAEVDDTLHETAGAVLPIVSKRVQMDVTITVQQRALALGFNAKSVTIDNASGQWFWVPIIDQWVLPWQHGLVVNLVGGTQTADFIAMTPTGQVSAPVAGQCLTAVFRSINLSPSAGALLPSAGGVAGTVNQGNPNAGGALAWPVSIVGSPSLAITTLSFNLVPMVNGLNVIKAAPGKLYDWQVDNPNNVDVFLQLFDSGANNFATGAGLLRSYRVPAATTMDKAFGLAPVNFGTTIVAAISTLAATGINPAAQSNFTGGYV